MKKPTRFIKWFLSFTSIFIIISISGFANDRLSSVISKQDSQYLDTFEHYVTTKLVQQAYQVWEDGARLEVSLDSNKVGIGAKSLRVDVISPNPMDNVTSGSLYHSLPLNRRDWSNSSGFRFWISNPSKDSLWLTFNFKESYNEYWAVTPGAPFLINNGNSSFIQLECQYGNLVIPSEFVGWVTIPIESFSVPEWNTARGDKQLQLSSIESFALGVTVQNDYPRTFFLDNIEVLSPGFVIPVINGVKEIEIPSSGELLNKFQLIDRTKGNGQSVEWNVEASNNKDLSITQDGSLIVPSTAKAGFVTITASTISTGQTNIISEKIQITGGAFPITEDQSLDASYDIVPVPTKSEYEKFASDFEKWAMDYRPLFVIISVSLVVLFIFLLSRFQNKLK